MSKNIVVDMDVPITTAEDKKKRRVNVHQKKDGTMQITCPSGTPGTLKVLLELPPDEAKEFLKNINAVMAPKNPELPFHN